MRGKRGLGGLACALAAMLLTACYAGVEHMLEEDYNPRFIMEEPLPQVQVPAPPQHSVFLTTDWMQDVYYVDQGTGLNLGVLDVVNPDYRDGAKAEWTVKKNNGDKVEDELYLYNDYGVQDGGGFVDTFYFDPQKDYPITVVCKISAGGTSCHDQAVYELKPTP